MSRPTFIIEPDLVRISIRGVPNSKGSFHCPNDQGLVQALLQAMHDRQLPPAVRIEQSGGGTLVGLWYSDGAELIHQWLESRADEVIEHPKSAPRKQPPVMSREEHDEDNEIRDSYNKDR